MIVAVKVTNPEVSETASLLSTGESAELWCTERSRVAVTLPVPSTDKVNSIGPVAAVTEVVPSRATTAPLSRNRNTWLPVNESINPLSTPLALTDNP
ncbi:hypothetical protein CfE428DRAFT_6706 [Chthoniobacter flavus Ellin428]|uniref:Uncharacterized protein n=1 Tax=Chthoniobacter flavus Ellin428 TaxID=497964 RepID=B4DCR5_9BACT|nr:hypothetical protein CfE428DRAFT_6706 [Chthoniobacter flavus Ellin428]